MDPSVNLWSDAEHAEAYLERADSVPHREQGERALLEWLPATTERVLDLGSGDGRLVSLVRAVHPASSAVAVDFSSAMLERLTGRFASDPAVTVVSHDLDEPLPESWGAFDAVVSSFAIHHLSHPRKRALYIEVFERVKNGGVLCNLEHVSSPTDVLHLEFLDALGIAPEEEDPSNQLLDVETQLTWLREAGFVDVDCLWKWRELALLVGRKPAV